MNPGLFSSDAAKRTEVSHEPLVQPAAEPMHKQTVTVQAAPLKAEKSAVVESNQPVKIENILIEVSPKGRADFNTLSEAIAFVNQGNPNAYYTIKLDTGNYIEPAMTITGGRKVSIRGCGSEVTSIHPAKGNLAMFEYASELEIGNLKMDGMGMSGSGFKNLKGKVSLRIENVFMLRFQEGVNAQFLTGGVGGHLMLNRVEMAEMSGHPIRVEASEQVPFEITGNGLVVISTKQISRGLMLSGKLVKAQINEFCSHKNPNIPGTPFVTLNGAQISLQDEHFSGFDGEFSFAGRIN